MDAVKHTIKMIENNGMEVSLTETICSNISVIHPDIWGQYIIIAGKK